MPHGDLIHGSSSMNGGNRKGGMNWLKRLLQEPFNVIPAKAHWRQLKDFSCVDKCLQTDEASERHSREGGNPGFQGFPDPGCRRGDGFF